MPSTPSAKNVALPPLSPKVKGDASIVHNGTSRICTAIHQDLPDCPSPPLYSTALPRNNRLRRLIPNLLALCARGSHSSALYHPFDIRMPFSSLHSSSLRSPPLAPFLNLTDHTLSQCVFNYLQSYLFIIYPLLQNYSLLLKTSVPGAILLTIGFGTLWAIPGIRGEEDDYFEPFRQTQGWKLADAGVEEHHRTLVRILVTVGATAVLCSLAMVGIAGWGVWRERRRKGYAVLGLEEGLDGADMDMDDEEDDEIAMKTL